MNRKAIKNNAKITLQEHRWISVGAHALFSLLVKVCSFIPGGALVLTGVFSYGNVDFFLTQTDDIKTVFSGFKNFAKSFLAGLLQFVYTSLWTLLFIIPGIIKTYSYALTYYILKDNPELTANEAITKSREMMKGYKWKFFVLQLSFLGWDILGMLTFGILSILYVNPYKQYAYAEFYRKVKGE